jgi:hypothetical protein
MVFEQLVAEAAIKKEKEKENRRKGKEKKGAKPAESSTEHEAAKTAADAPNVPKASAA